MPVFLNYSPKDPEMVVTIGDGVKVEAERVISEAGRTVVKVNTPVEITVVWDETTTVVGAVIMVSDVIVCAGAVTVVLGLLTMVSAMTVVV